MKKIKKKLQTKLSGEILTLASCYKIKLRDGRILGFTNFEKNLVINGVTYVAQGGFNSSAYNASIHIAPDNTEISARLDHENIKKEDLMKGIFDHGEITIFLVDYTAPDSGIVILQHGYFGEINFTNNQFTAEIHSISKNLNKNFTANYSPKCCANLGDAKCSMNRDNYAYYGTVSEIINNTEIIDKNLDKEDGYYNFGQITFLSGKNKGATLEIKNYYRGHIISFMPVKEEIGAGDEFKIIAGCDKNFSTCISKFNNALNFRGQPHLPGNDAILSIY